MSKYVKQLIIDNYRQRFAGLTDAVLVNVIGLKGPETVALRSRLRQKGIRLLVIKNSLAARAAAGTPLARLFDGISGPCAICWGGEDVVTLAKELVQLEQDGRMKPFAARAALVNGAKISGAQLAEVSKWPTRQEQLSILAGQILAVGRILSGQLLASGGRLAGQIKKLAEETSPETNPVQSEATG